MLGRLRGNKKTTKNRAAAEGGGGGESRGNNNGGNNGNIVNGGNNNHNHLDMYGVRSLIGGSGISLDGRSLQLPPPNGGGCATPSTTGRGGPSSPAGSNNHIVGLPSGNAEEDGGAATASNAGGSGQGVPPASDAADAGNDTSREEGGDDPSFATGGPSILSLAGHSLLMFPQQPVDGDGVSMLDCSYGDDGVSSIASASIYYQGPVNMRIVGAVNNNNNGGGDSSMATNDLYKADDDNSKHPSSPKQLGGGMGKGDPKLPDTPGQDTALTTLDGDNHNNNSRGKKKATGGCFEARYCVPAWLRRAPRWLKVLLLASLLFVAAAIALVAVTLVLAFAKQNDGGAGADATSSSAQTDDQQNSAGVPTDFQPYLPQPSDGAASAAPVPAPDVTDSSVATTTAAPTGSPTPVPDPLITKFRLTAGRYPAELREEVTLRLSELPKDGSEFLVNLGDWNSPSTTDCVLSAYEEIATNFSYSPIPVYFVVGDNEYNGAL